MSKQSVYLKITLRLIFKYVHVKIILIEFYLSLFHTLLFVCSYMNANCLRYVNHFCTYMSGMKRDVNKVLFHYIFLSHPGFVFIMEQMVIEEVFI